MASCSALRRVSTTARIMRRHASTSSAKTPSNAASTSTKSYFLTPEKKRALISLYHQSDTFITPENLSDKIDEAFIKRRRGGDAPSMFNTTVTNVELLGLAGEQKRAPKFSEWDRERRGTVGVSQWSGGASPREWRVIEALYGVDESDGQNAMPGLEALEEFVKSEEAEKSKSS
ncbi:hypothetical protein PM082_005181 [Marasmius tenuissimus]|nr:hypothetical protein PM082_005181 [Marasmius tenuissimus]